MKKEWTSHNEQETTAIAGEIVAMLQAPTIICLYGNLGAGKTAFSRAFIRYCLNDIEQTVPSPTYTLVQTYRNDTIWHFDLYRLEAAHQLYDIGWEEALAADYVLIEWPERLGQLKPQNSVDIHIETLDNGARHITVNL